MENSSNTLVGLLADIHIGHRNDSVVHDQHLRDFFTKQFIPELITKNIRNVIVCGDLFDRRSHIKFETLYKWKRQVFDLLHENHINFHVLVGNHDVAFRNSNKINSPELLLAEYDNVIVHTGPRDFNIGGIDFAMIPWINDENREQTYEYINNTKAQVAIAHLELNGFAMRPGENCDHGIDRRLFERFVAVYTGHFHLQSQQNGIRYLGCPTEHSVGESGQPIGYHILDCSSLELTFVPSNERLYVDVVYTGKGTVVPDVTGKFVRVYNRARDRKFNAFVAGLETHLRPHHIEVFDVVETGEQQEVAIDVKDIRDMNTIIRDIVHADTTIEQEDRTNIVKLANELYQASISKQ